MPTLPHAIPYQGSKRKLAPQIAEFLPTSCDVFFEPFCGSASITIFAAANNLARKYVIGDKLPEIVDLMSKIVQEPEKTARGYRQIWSRARRDEVVYFNEIRTNFNETRDPILLLYLICRCVKNAIRFNSAGRFSQSVDKRRLGMHPEKMERAILHTSALLKNKSEFRVGDWQSTTHDVTINDFVYLDPPYLGTTTGPDKRYFKQVSESELLEGLRRYLDRSIPFVLSYDGMTGGDGVSGGKIYGPPLPSELGLTRKILNAGRSAQSTLAGQNQNTYESLYISPLIGTKNGMIGTCTTPPKRLNLFGEAQIG